MPDPTPPTDVAANPVATLLATVRRTGLLAPATLAEVEARPEANGDDAKPLGRFLFQNGYLTRYQLNQAALGRDEDLIVGPYILLDRVAEGGGGQVFRARHRVMNRIVALKRIRPEMLDKPELVARFFQESQVAAQLDHPNVVRAYDAGEAGRSHFLAMEFVDGIDLTRLVREGGPLPVVTACDFARQTALSALQHAHERGLVHRDIKPSNLLVTPVVRANGVGSPRPGPNPQIKLLDLGLARWHTASAPGKGPAMGSPHFVAPEQARNIAASDIRSDLYCVGGTLFFLLTGQTPFSGTSVELVQAHLSKPAPRVETIRPGVPTAIGDIIAKLLEKDPANRFAKPAELAAALAPFAKQLAGEKPAAPNSPPAPATNNVLSFTDDVVVDDPEDDGVLPIASMNSAGMRYTARNAGISKRSIYLAFGIGLHVLAFVIVGVIIWKKYQSVDDPVVPPLPKTIVKVIPSVKDKEKPPIVIAKDKEKDDKPEPPTTVDAKTKGKNKGKSKNKSVELPVRTPAPVELARGLPPADKGPLDVTISGLPSHSVRAFPKNRPILKKLSDATPRDGVKVLAALSEKAGLLIAGDASLRLFDAKTGKERGVLPGGPATVFELNPNGILAAGIVGGRLQQWSVDPPGAGQTFANDPGGAKCLVHSPNGNFVLSGGDDGNAHLWDLLQAKAERTLAVGEPVTAVAIAPNGWLAVIGTENGQVGFWDLESQARLAMDTRHRGPVRGVAVAPDGSEAVSVGEDGKLFVWSLVNGKAKSFFEYMGPLVQVNYGGPGWCVAGMGASKLLLINITERRTIEYGAADMGEFQTAALSLDGKVVFAAFSRFGIGRLDLEAPVPNPPPGRSP